MAFRLKSAEFRRERERAWSELEGLVGRAEGRGLGSLTAEQLYRLPALYRMAVSSLSVARAISLDKNLLAYLESLSARAYVAVYGAKHDFSGSVRHFFSRLFPELLWSMRGGLALSIGLLLLGTTCGFVLTLEDNERFHAFVSEEMAAGRTPSSSREDLLASLRDDGGALADELTFFATFLFTHNARIGLLCFALGFAAGVPVALLLFTNGLMLGAFAAAYTQHGLTLEFWAWLLPHGITELLAVAICGAAGFALGHRVVFPGPYRRLESLARRGREAAAVVVGAAALFFLAALIEGFFRQLVHDTGVRLGLATLTALFWVVYFGRAWRREPSPPQSPSPGGRGGSPEGREP